MAANSRICVLFAAGNNGESECIQHCGIRRRVARCSRGAGEPCASIRYGTAQFEDLRGSGIDPEIELELSMADREQ